MPLARGPFFLLGPCGSERGAADLCGDAFSLVGKQVLANALKQLDRVHQLQVGKAQQLFLSPIFSPPSCPSPFGAENGIRPVTVP